MPRTRTIRLIAFAAGCAVLAAAAPWASAQERDIQTSYATVKGACTSGSGPRVVIAKGRISGPGFDCTLGKPRPAGTGLVAYEATCMVDGKKSSEGLALDLGNYRDHFELSLPGREDWLTLYPCTPVPGLN